MSIRRLRNHSSNPGTATTVSQLGLSAWLVNSATSGSISSITDTLNINPATQGTAARQPTAVAGPAISWDGGDVLAWPITSQNFATSQWAIALWLKTPLSVGGRQIYRIRNTGAGGGANVDSISIFVSSTESIQWEVWLDATNVRRASTAVSVIGDNAPRFLTAEFDGTRSSDAEKVTITLGGDLQVLSFIASAGVAPAMPSTFRSATGNVLLGAGNTAGTSAPFTGTWGKDFFVTTSKMVDASEGLWSPAARRILMNNAPLA